jgi:tetratricopeptide (TPR) repeat protein/predicted aspartyl protease
MPAMAACSIGKLVDLPVTMSGRMPLVSARFGDKDARFILDSGAFYSTLSHASAEEFGLRVAAAPAGFHVNGIGGTTSAGIVVAKNFSLAGVNIPNANFVAGGSDTGTAGLIGQNILGIADVEYDLPHAAVRLMESKGCGKSNLAYWAGDKPVTAVTLMPGDGPFKPHTIGTVLLNGVKIKAMFDSGAQTSLISLAAAKRAGVTPQSPGVVRDGFSGGLGTHRLPSWLAPFDSIDIGGERINHPRINISEVDFNNADMLIGVDFFLTHRLYVANMAHMLFITYEGGPVFNLSPKGAISSDGKALDLTDKAAGPVSAEEYSRRGAALASNHRLIDALLDFDKACALAPTEARYFFQRAIARLANRQRAAALGDLDQAITLAPGDPETRLVRAGLRVHERDQSVARADVTAADHLLAPSSEKRLRVASLYNELDLSDGAIVNYDLWLKSHTEDSGRASALNGRCWARGLLGRELDKALSDCNAAVRLQPGNPAFLDSRALVRLRRGETAQALADYNAALSIAPGNAWSLYARNIAEGKAGDTVHATADRAAALRLNPNVADRARRIGLEQ